MIPLFAVAAAAALDNWMPVGVTDTRLRVFVDRDSIHDVDGRRRATVRIGAPKTIVGKIVLVYQHEEIDCAARTWRLVGFEAENDAGRTISRSSSRDRPGPMLPAIDHSIGGEVVGAVCGLQGRLPRTGKVPK